jgi:hypothetical protein
MMAHPELPRGGAVVRGTIVSFTASAWTALVLIDGSLAEVSMPVLESTAGQLLAADDIVAVLLFDETNPEAGVILGPYGSTGLLASYLEQAEIAAPSTPASGFLRWYAHTTTSWAWFINDAGKAIPAGKALHHYDLTAGVLAGSATRIFVQTYHPAINMPDAATSEATWTIRLPRGWAGRTLTVDVHWSPSTTNTNNAVLQVNAWLQRPGTTLTAVATAAAQVTAAANGTVDRPQLSTFALTLASFAEDDSIVLMVTRLGTAGADTFTGAVQVHAVEASVVG